MEQMEKMEQNERIEHLRERALCDDRFGTDTEFYTLFYKQYEKSASLSEEARYAEAFYYAFCHLTPVIGEGELVVGSRDMSLSTDILSEWEETYRDIAFAHRNEVFCGQDSHMAIDYPLILTKGLSGIIDQIDGYLKDCVPSQKAFYECCKKCLEAVICHARAYAQLAYTLSTTCSDPSRRQELEALSAICSKVPERPAETFYEAVQSVHFVTHCLSFNPFRMCCQQFQLGHPDRYLLPYYERDLQNKTLTREKARLLLDCLGIQINMRVSNGLSSGYMVGGRDENGAVVCNELTELCLQVIGDIRLVYPAVGLCYTDGISERVMELACTLLLEGHSHPALFNDDVITRGLMHYGVPEHDVHSYIHSTCVEITPTGSSNVWVASPYTNMPQLLLDIMDTEYESFEALFERYFEVLDARIRANFEAENRNRALRAEKTLNPLLSCFVNDCLANGKDIERGGARYNWIMPSFVGVSNLVDALYAIRTLVFERKELSLCAYKKLLDDDFEHQESFRQYILSQLPKYGNDIDDVDRLYGVITEHISAECEKYHGLHSNASLIPSVFCWIMHERFGAATQATPDGRKAGFPLGDGSGPCQGREASGPTASILSSTKWCHQNFIGGVAVNLKFSKALLGTGAQKALEALLVTYLASGGFEVQVNVVDNETLRKAQKAPESYRDLIVRIGGYSDYFVRLSREMQEEVLLRTAHGA